MNEEYESSRSAPPSYTPPPAYRPPEPATPRRGGLLRTLGWLALTGFGLFVVLSLVVGALTGARDDPWNKTGPKVGVVTLAGPIFDETAHKVVKQLEKMADNEKVSAIVLRIESPGGAIAPSQEVFATVKRLRAKKPIVASMGQLAASGGYYVALPANKIFAQPGTITGSIGVIASTTVVKKLLEEKLGVRSYVYKSGRLKDALSAVREPQKEDEEFIAALIAEFYDQYAEDVLAERKIDPRKIAEIKEAQIVTGRQALKLKMIDALGTLHDAAVAALAAANVPGEPVLVPPRRDPDEFFEQLFGGALAHAASRLGFDAAAALGPAYTWQWTLSP